ncbi:MAG: transporter substrate-binding domain-containing protein [Roseibium sp.]
MRFSAFEAPSLTPFAEEILSRAYADLGIGMEVVVSTPRRALLDAASGRTDGELVRVRRIGSLHETLIRVEVPVFISRSIAFVRKPEFASVPLDDLKHLRAGHVSGANFARKFTEGFAEIWRTETPEQLVDMLKRDRVDLIILGEATAQRLSREIGMNGIFPLSASLGEVCFYHYLHQKHAALVPRVEQALRRITGGEAVDPCAPSENGLLEGSDVASRDAESS